MTNSSIRSALKRTLVLSALLLAGCGEKAPERHPADVAMDVVREKLRLGELSAARAALAQAAVTSKDDADVILLGAQLAYHEKDYKAATQAYSAFAADTTRDAKLRADAYVGLAVVAMTLNETDRARIALLNALRVDRRSTPARYHLGLLYRNLGYEEAALEQFEAFTLLETVDAPRVQRVQRQMIPALKDAIARKATERPGVDKRDSAASSKAQQSAEEMVKKGNFKKAKAYYADALKADPLSYPAALGLATMWEKTDTSANGKRQALACYQTACSLKPSAIKTLLATGNLAASLGSNTVAAEAYSRAIAADPKNLSAIDGLIRAQRKLGGDAAKTAALWQTYRTAITPSRKSK